MKRYFQETHPASFKKGTNDFARFDGMLVDGLQIGYVNGFGYKQMVPASDGEVPERIQRVEHGTSGTDPLRPVTPHVLVARHTCHR